MDNLGVPPLLGNSIFETTPSMFFGARQFHVVPVLLWSEMGLSPKQQSTPKSICLSSFPHWKCHIYIYPGWWFQPLWKIWKSVGMMKFPIYGKIKMFQTTNQYHIYHKLSRIFRHTHMDPFHIISSLQWEFQDPKVEVLYHRRPYFVGIFPYIG